MNTGKGIYCGIFTTQKIVLNKIEYNKQGIYSLSADPWIFMNKIINNLQEGAFFTSSNVNMNEAQ